MSTITTRSGKGSPLTYAELDANFTSLNTDKLEKAGGSVTGALVIGGVLTANGGITGTTANFSGTLNGVAASFSGALTGTSATFSGAVSGASFSTSGNGSLGSLSVSGASAHTGTSSFTGAATFNGGVTSNKSFDPTVAGSAPGVVSLGTFGGGIALKDSGLNSGFYTAGSGTDLYLYTGAAASDRADAKIRMMVQGSTGNVGFGYTSPGAALHAYRSTAVDVSLLCQNSAGFARYGVDTGGVARITTGSLDIYTGTTTKAVSLNAAGDVGIGVASPGAALDVQRGTNAYARLKSTSSGYALFDIDSVASQQAIVRFMAAGVEQGRILSGANEGAGIMIFATGAGATESMRMTGGRVAVNRTSAVFGPGTGRLAVAYPGNTDWGIGLRDTSGQATVYPMVFLNSSEVVVGSISHTAVVTSYNTASDERLKENIADAGDSGAVVEAIQIRQFDWIATGEHQDFGVIAQELEQVFPAAVPAVTLGPNGEEMYRGVDYSKLVPLLVKELQSLRARVAQLEGGAP